MSVHETVVSRDDDRHLWQQVADALRQEASALEPGARLASEAQLRERFSISRVTLRQALTHLQRAGVLKSRPGLGWFTSVSRPADEQEPPRAVFEPAGLLMSFTDLARSRGLEPDSVVLDQSLHEATVPEAEALAVAPGAPIMRLQRLPRIDGLAVAVDTSLVPLSVLPEAMSVNFAAVSLHDCFRAAGAAPAVVELEVEAMVAGATEAKQLDVARGAPLLHMRQAFFDGTGRPIERGFITYRADRYRHRARQTLRTTLN